MSQLVRVLEKSTTLREFYYNKYVQELQAIIESQKNTIRELRDTIAGQNAREEIMEREYDKLRDRIALHDHPDHQDHLYEVDFSRHEQARGRSDPESRDSDDEKYHNEGRCYDRGRLCGMPYCKEEWSTWWGDCMSCRAKLCYGHLREGHLVSGYEVTDIPFYQCYMCWDRMSAIRECMCVVCDKLYDPHDNNITMVQVNDPFVISDIKCLQRDMHIWACREHCNDSDIQDAIKAKNHTCTLCNPSEIQITRCVQFEDD